MVNSLRVRNFRCYRDLRVGKLKRVNVIVGANGSGKTALLESIFLASGGSPELAFRLQLFRGMAMGAQVTNETLRKLWQDLFYQFDQDSPIDIDLLASDSTKRHLRIALGHWAEVNLPSIEFDREGSGLSVDVPLDFVWTNASGQQFESRPKIVNGQVTFQSARDVNRVVFLASHQRGNMDEVARRLSQLKKTDELHHLLSICSEMYPDIEDASVEDNAGAWQPFIKLKGMSERMPIALHSAGATRFLSILLAIANAPNGIVLIDEVENGFYFRTFPVLWRALHAMADVSGCQLFISTHSQECIQAILPSMQERIDDFCLLKTDRDDFGQATVFASEGEVMAAAIQSGFEVR